MKPVAINLTATTTPQVYEKICYNIKSMRNIGSNPIKVSFNEPINDTTKNYFYLVAGGGFEEWAGIQIDTIYYQATTGTSDFFVWTETN